SPLLPPLPSPDALPIFAATIATGYHYRTALAYYFSFKSKVAEEDKLHAIRNFQVLSNHQGKSFGFDVSQYQGKINWYQADSIERSEEHTSELQSRENLV